VLARGKATLQEVKKEGWSNLSVLDGQLERVREHNGRVLLLHVLYVPELQDFLKCPVIAVIRQESPADECCGDVRWSS
jgi:hypothetical protein